MMLVNLLEVLKAVGYGTQAGRQVTVLTKKMLVEKTENNMYDSEVVAKALKHIANGKGKAEYITASQEILTSKKFMNYTTETVETEKVAKGKILKLDLETRIEYLESLLEENEIEFEKRDYKISSEKA